MPLLGARFCCDRLIDNPCSFPAEKPHLACLMPDLFRVSTGSPLPRSAECSVCLSLSVEPPGSMNSASKAQALMTLWMPVCFITTLATWEILHLSQDHYDGNPELGLWQCCSLAACYQQPWLAPHLTHLHRAPATLPSPQRLSQPVLSTCNCSAWVPASG